MRIDYRLIRVGGSDRRKRLRHTEFVGVAMKNQSVRIAFAAVVAIFGAVLFTTCTVGLGDSVDTKAPAVSITYPPVQSIIKNTFTLRGTASDDNELVGVRVTITNTDTDEVFDGYQATVDKATNTWTFVANRRGGDGVFELPDGNYQVVARAVDGANRQTVTSTTLEIDNTAPVLVLNRPGTSRNMLISQPVLKTTRRFSRRLHSRQTWTAAGPLRTAAEQRLMNGIRRTAFLLVALNKRRRP